MNSEASSGSYYDVFLSFRGPDTRHGFTDCLYHDMVDAGILVFRDDESLRVGKRISDELERAINNSKFYIPIFSKNYAVSRWCLQELAYMVDCTSKTSKTNENKEILPIFFDVEPDDVKLKTEFYRQALSEHRRKFCTETVESWEKALVEVGKIKGWNLKKDEGQGDLIRSIIRTLSVKLKVAYENVTQHLVGVDNRVEAIVKMLDVGSDGVRFLGIHGMGGVGKTTLAKVVFNTLSSGFDRCCFLADVRESSKGYNGLVSLQKQLLSVLLGSHSISQIYHENDVINMMNRGVLRNKKVLIILDDVDEKVQLKSLAKNGNWFGHGSRIIITTRDQSVLMIEGEAASEGPGKKSTKVLTYEVQEMKFGHALKLFSRHAFRRDFPPDHRVSLSENIVHTLGKLPLALEITGSSLSGKSKALWEDTLKKLKEAPPMEVQRKLLITYERLDHAQRQVFLDIACLFVKQDKTYPFYMWEACRYHPHDALEVLILLSLIKVKEDNTFWMHDQVRDLGKEIVRQENYKDPCERSRVWSLEEGESILKWKEGTRKVEVLSLGYFGVHHRVALDDKGHLRYEYVTLRHDQFANLRKLRFLEGNGMFLVGDFKNLLPNLRWLSWQDCSPKFEATNFHPTNLVVLDLSRSHISEDWIGWNQIKAARQLKVLNLSHCSFSRTPDLSTWVSLDRLILEGCFNLIEIDPSIGKLKLLTSLNLKNCSSLQKLPEEIGCLHALTEIVVPNRLCELPETFGNLQSLLNFEVPNRLIEELPYSIGQLRSLVKLDLSWTSIGHLPDSIGNLKQLKVLRMKCMSKMTKLSRAIGLMEKLEELDVCRCQWLTGDIPKEIGALSCLRILCLSYTYISGLPTTMSYLSNLQTLNLELCPKLKQLPELPTSLTRLKWTHHEKRDSFEDLMEYEHFIKPKIIVHAPPTSIGQLETLELSGKHLQFLPQFPSSLRELRLVDLKTTQSLDFSNLKNLSDLAFYDCSMPQFSGIFDAELKFLRMRNCKFEKPDTLFQLEIKRLTCLDMKSCEFLPEVLDLSRMKNLEIVFLDGCKSLVEICGIEEVGSLFSLAVVDCSSMEIMSGLSKLKELHYLQVYNCPKLRSIERLSYLGSLKLLCIENAGEFGADISNLNLEVCDDPSEA